MCVCGGADITRYGMRLVVTVLERLNSNGLNLLNLCSEFNLATCSTVFRQKELTWIHPRSKDGYMIYFIITRRDDLKDARVFNSAECDTDQKLIRGKFKLQVGRKVSLVIVTVPKRINVARVSQSGMFQQLSDAFSNVTFSGSWGNFKDQAYSSNPRAE